MNDCESERMTEDGYVPMDVMKLFLERHRNGDPLRDYYDESEVHGMLADAYEEMLEQRNY